MCAFSLMFGNDSRCFVCVCVFLSFLPSAVARIMSILPEKFSQFSKLGGGGATAPQAVTNVTNINIILFRDSLGTRNYLGDIQRRSNKQ